jgi:exopolyphosphatase/guanosine-5'-triphosphate,3'-diphosphate pyrophosphatase
MLPDRIQHAAECIQRFCEHARSHGSEKILAVATECVRRAENRRVFLDTVMQASGIDVEVINPERESTLARKGVQAVMPGQAGEEIIIDIGGGTTDFSFISSGCFLKSASLPMGVIEPAERYMLTDPPSETEVMAMRTWADSVITTHRNRFPERTSAHPAAIIATAGTATTLAAMDLELKEYKPARVNGHTLSLDAIQDLLAAMVRISLAKRKLMAGLEPGRAQVIIPGTLILMQLMRYFGCTSCTISDAGLLEGIITDYASLKKLIEKT